MHRGCLDERTGRALVITAGACHDAPRFEPVFEQWPAEHEREHGVRDTGDESDQTRNTLREDDREPVIPPRSQRQAPCADHQEVDTLRHQVDRLIHRLKPLRRSATRYEKLAITFLG